MSWDRIALLAQVEQRDGGIAALIGPLIVLALVIVTVAGVWKTFEKAGEPGWGAIVPFYNLYLLCKIAGKPGWWLILFIVPLVNLIISLLVTLGIAKNFGKGPLFGLGLMFLGFIFYPILGFGDARYRGTNAY